eukprot:2135558-Pleurochrysis_carterae.AAC.2
MRSVEGIQHRCIGTRGSESDLQHLEAQQVQETRGKVGLHGYSLRAVSVCSAGRHAFNPPDERAE